VFGLQGRRWVTSSDPWPMWPTEYLIHDPYDSWPTVEHFRWCCENVLVIHCDNERSEIKHKNIKHARLSDYHALEIGMPSERWTVKTHTISWQKDHTYCIDKRPFLLLLLIYMRFLMIFYARNICGRIVRHYDSERIWGPVLKFRQTNGVDSV